MKLEELKNGRKFVIGEESEAGSSHEERIEAFKELAKLDEITAELDEETYKLKAYRSLSEKSVFFKAQMEREKAEIYFPITERKSFFHYDIDIDAEAYIRINRFNKKKHKGWANISNKKVKIHA